MRFPTALLVVMTTIGFPSGSTNGERVYGTWKERQARRQCRTVSCQYRSEACAANWNKPTCVSLREQRYHLACPYVACVETASSCFPEAPMQGYQQVPLELDECPLGENCYSPLPGFVRPTTTKATTTTTTATTTVPETTTTAAQKTTPTTAAAPTTNPNQ